MNTIHLPAFLALPLFRRIYPLVRRKEGGPIPPIQRRVRLVPGDAAYEFNRLFNASLLYKLERPIPYDLPYPKIDFINYLCDWRGLVAHGTSQADLKVLEPVRLSTDASEFGNRKQVFSSPDATWAMWFAILDKSRFHTTRNGCIGVGDENHREKYYHFELDRELQGQHPFQPGMLYFSRPEDFPSRHSIPILQFFGADFEEWGSEAPVTPLAKIGVEPQDFPYLDLVQYCIDPE